MQEEIDRPFAKKLRRENLGKLLRWIRKGVGKVPIILIKATFLLVFSLALASTFFYALNPFKPTGEEWEGSFPQNWEKEWGELSITFVRRLVLLNEFSPISFILELLSRFFLLLLIHSVWEVVKKLPAKAEDLHSNYQSWAIGSLLITIVFISRGINSQNILEVSAGILLLILCIGVLFLIFRGGFFWKDVAGKINQMTFGKPK